MAGVGTAPETGAVGVIRFSVLSGAVAAGSAANQVGSWSRRAGKTPGIYCGCTGCGILKTGAGNTGLVG
jgi:hypothetical protein